MGGQEEGEGNYFLFLKAYSAWGCPQKEHQGGSGTHQVRHDRFGERQSRTGPQSDAAYAPSSAKLGN